MMEWRVEGEELGFERTDGARIRVLSLLEVRGIRVWRFLRRSPSIRGGREKEADGGRKP